MTEPSPLLKFALRARNFILGLIYVLPVFSLAVVFALYNKDRESEYLSFPVKKHEYLWLVIKISAGLSLFLILFAGIEKLLFFIPSSWESYNEDMETWTNIRSYVALVFSVFFWGFIISVLFKNKEKTPDNKDSYQKPE